MINPTRFQSQMGKVPRGEAKEDVAQVTIDGVELRKAVALAREVVAERNTMLANMDYGAQFLEREATIAEMLILVAGHLVK